ncbi:hypothetical protein [Dysgonomonas sp. 520]|uniref:hypothetical protein n=1 Tax=Dysgonomonas sp. 520 TaxID=2302931 RepID=UPI0013D29C38|nr:hypothetical protein [Dysgonomonas sp. 520]NDW09833.1 hypothetical protein [Dysgonomonas sp. 520]
MVQIEFYINNKLIDVTDADKLGIRLNRQIFKPAEFTSKDSQMSYTITIPNTVTNNKIFNYANVEEVKDKFNIEYDAKVYIDFILVFNGKFMLKEISETTYKGNLYVPVYKSVKDIFGDRTMNAPSNIPDKNKWWFNFYYNNADVITEWNYDVQLDMATNNKSKDCMFPFILYGLMPKVTKDPSKQVNGEQVGDFTDKDLYDSFVRMGFEDIPPAMNVMNTIQKMFEANDLSIEGTAFQDDKLKHLYMSYSNPSDYNQEWNYGNLCNINVSGNWETIKDKNRYISLFPSTHNLPKYERLLTKNSMNGTHYYVVDLLDSINSTITYTDSGSNITYNEWQYEQNDDRYIRKNCLITIPKSGWYKVTLNSQLYLCDGGENQNWTDPITKQRYIQTRTERNSKWNNWFGQKEYEIQVLRDYAESDFGLDNRGIVGYYFKPNLPQNNTFNGNSTDNYPKYFPQNQKPLIVDPSADSRFVCGLHFGRRKGNENYNPKVTDGATTCNTMYVKSGWSWDNTFYQKQRIYNLYDNNHWVHFWGDIEAELSDVEADDDVATLAWNSGDVYKNRCILNDISLPQSIETYDLKSGGGQASCIIWLEEGEHLTVAAVGESGVYRREGHSVKRDYGCWVADNINFSLSIEPFRTDITYNKQLSNGEPSLDDNGNPVTHSWNDSIFTEDGFLKDKINLFSFLPSEIKVNDFIDNICKAFNLRLSQPEKGKFRLDVKQVKELGKNGVVDFENKFNIKQRTNEPLGLPSEINIKFSINEDEEGYVSTNEDGGGTFVTGAVDGSTIEQSSTFSYCWYKDIRFTKRDNTIAIDAVPIISKHEVWENPTPDDYSEMQKKWYTDLPLRFFYPDDVIGIDGDYDFNSRIFKIGSQYANLMRVKNDYDITMKNILDYKNVEHSILNNYFTLITTNDTNYTTIETYLTAEEYELLDGRNLIKLNSDLYYVSEISGYDPLMKQKTQIKLIRKI